MNPNAGPEGPTGLVTSAGGSAPATPKSSTPNAAGGSGSSGAFAGGPSGGSGATDVGESGSTGDNEDTPTGTTYPDCNLVTNPCDALGYECGLYDYVDNCGIPQTINCGACTG